MTGLAGFLADGRQEGEPTDAERDLAEELGYRLQGAVTVAERQACRDDIAQAFAAQRAALASQMRRVRELADEAEARHQRYAMPLFDGYRFPATVTVASLRAALDER